MRSRAIRTALAAVAGLAIAAQLVPVDRTNPPVTREILWDAPATRDLAQRACYDCHSNDTDWPWYARVAPASWLVAKDVAEGREHLNFSMWDRPNEDVEKILEMVRDGEMPLKKCTLLHPEARLDEQERATLMAGLEATLGADPPVSEESDEGQAHE